MTNFMRYALTKMLYETCGEDPDLINNVKITEFEQTEENRRFHVQYKENDPYEGLDFKVQITFEENPNVIKHRYTATYVICESVWGDPAVFDIEL